MWLFPPYQSYGEGCGNPTDNPWRAHMCRDRQYRRDTYHNLSGTVKTIRHQVQSKSELPAPSYAQVG